MDRDSRGACRHECDHKWPMIIVQIDRNDRYGARRRVAYDAHLPILCLAQSEAPI